FDLPRRLSWRDLICFVEKNERGEVTGKVEHLGKVYYTFSEVTQHYIHTTAIDPSERGSKKLIFEASSEVMKQKFLQDISKDFSVELELLCLQKNSEGIPTIY
ncbi:hypothetical protein, partial [Longispora fulva]